jgi:hypothetical protein
MHTSIVHANIVYFVRDTQTSPGRSDHTVTQSLVTPRDRDFMPFDELGGHLEVFEFEVQEFYEEEAMRTPQRSGIDTVFKAGATFLDRNFASLIALIPHEPPRISRMLLPSSPPEKDCVSPRETSTELRNCAVAYMTRLRLHIRGHHKDYRE